MEKVLIENYRGFDIEFDMDNEKFQCVCTEDNSKESKSFKAVKKFIDDYKKENQNFNPFWIESAPDKMYVSKKLRVIGIRKDGLLVAEDNKGEKTTISSYNLSDYMLVKTENEPLLNELKKLSEKFEEQRVSYQKEKAEVIAKFNIVSLKDFKQTLIG